MNISIFCQFSKTYHLYTTCGAAESEADKEYAAILSHTLFAIVLLSSNCATKNIPLNFENLQSAPLTRPILFALACLTHLFLGSALPDTYPTYISYISSKNAGVGLVANTFNCALV